MLNSHQVLKCSIWFAIVIWCCKNKTVRLWTLSKLLVTASHLQAVQSLLDHDAILGSRDLILNF